jgi:hypothetical protein
MPIANTTLVREEFRPSTGASTARKSGYANAWVIVFLAPVPGIQDDVSAMYSDWRRTFVEPSLLPGAVKGAPGSETLSLDELLSSTLLATTFGLIAARDQGDDSLYQRLERTLDAIEHTLDSVQTALPPSRRTQAATFRTILLFARTFRGWSEVLDPAQSH